MKITLSIIYACFFTAMACGLFVAFTSADGLVDNNYYDNSTHYFQSKALEEKLGIAISRPDTLKLGSNIFQIKATSHGKPLETGDLSLFIGNLSNTRYDSTMTMQQTSPGIYTTTASIPFKGVWFARIDLKQQQQHITSKKWFFNVQ
jgi:nitrogen fixation protein FixH